MKNQIIHGDCFEVLKSISDKSIDAVITDPPYKYLKHKLETNWDEKLFFIEVLRILKKDSFLVFFGRGESWFRWNYLCQELGFNFKEEIIWDKVRTSNPMCTMPRSHENIAIYTNGKGTLNEARIDKLEYDSIANPKAMVNDFKRMLATIKNINSWDDFILFKSGTLGSSDVIRRSEVTIQGGMKKCDRGSGTFKSHDKGRRIPSIFRCLNDYYNYVHPTQKPLLLIQKLIELTTVSGAMILDPFCGSGTTAVACKELGRNYICIEKELEYYQIACQRINQPIEPEKEVVPVVEELPKVEQLSLFG
jgi:site-specific DNA-methyltransferase (adenine-specific)